MRNRKTVNFFFYTIMTLFGMVITVLSPLLIPISKTFSLNLVEAGALFTANSMGFILFIFVGGMLADRFGKKIIFTISSLGFTLGLLFLPSASNFYLACIALVIIGGCGGVLESLVSVLVSELNPEKPSFYLNLVHGFFGLGALIGPILAGLLLSYGFSWQICYFILGGLAFIFTLGFLPVKLPGNQPSQTAHPNILPLLSDRKFLLICLCMVFYTGAEVSGWGWMSTFLKQNLRFSIVKSSIAVSLFWAALSFGRFACGQLTLRYRIKNIIITLAFSATVVTLLTGLAVNETAVYLTITAMGLAYSSLWPLIVAYGSNSNQNSSGTVFAILIGSGGIGSAIVPFFTGMIAQNVNITMAMSSPALLFLLIALIFISFKNSNTVKPAY